MKRAEEMTKAEQIIMAAALRTSKIGTSRQLAERSGMPYATLRNKFNNPGTIRLYDLAAWKPYCNFTGEEFAEIIRAIG